MYWYYFFKISHLGSSELITKGITILLFTLILVNIGACTNSDVKNNLQEVEIKKQLKLGPPLEDLLFSLPSDRTLTHEKISELESAVAFWVRVPDSIQLFITGKPSIGFRGHMGFGKLNSFYGIQPVSKGQDMNSSGEKMEKYVWLVWGPGSDENNEPLDKYLSFSSKGEHVLYLTYDNGEWLWKLDDKEFTDYHRRAAPVISNDAETVAWINSLNGKFHVVINGEIGQNYDGIYENTLHISADGAHTFYVALRNSNMIPVWDEYEQGEFKNLGNPVFSPNGERVAYSASLDGEKRFVVLDGLKSIEYDHVTALTFSQNGQSFAYRATQGDNTFYVINGKEQTLQFEKLSNEFIFDDKGERYSYAGIRNNKWFVVVDGDEGNPCDHIFGMTFSSDGKHFAKGEIESDSMNIFIDDEKQWTLNGKPTTLLEYSPNDTHLYFTISRGSQKLLVVDGVEQTPFEEVGGTTFSSDDSHFAFIAQEESGQYVVCLDGQKQSLFYSIPGFLGFTEAGQLFYCGFKNKKWFMVLDGMLSKPYDRIYIPASGYLPLNQEGILEYIALEGDSILHIQHTPINNFN